MSKRSWEIKELKKSHKLNETAVLVVNQKLDSVLETIDNYFTNQNEESLHKLRISLRRLRYNMELFIQCFDKQKFMVFYKNIKNLQDLSGSTRDLDVLLTNMKLLINKDHIEVPENIFEKFNAKRKELNSMLVLELMKFKHSKVLKDFAKMVN